MARFPDKRKKILVILLSLAVLGLIWLLDHVSWQGLSFIMLYLGPIFIATWFAGAMAGAGISLCSSAIWSFDDFVVCRSGEGLHIPFINTAVTFLFFLLLVFFISRIKRTLVLEEEYANTDYLTKAYSGRFFR